MKIAKIQLKLCILSIDILSQLRDLYTKQGKIKTVILKVDQNLKYNLSKGRVMVA